jgi:pimeloyl-ACP methyl ester carboxylesterase
MKWLVSLVLVLVAIAGAFALTRSDGDSPASDATATTTGSVSDGGEGATGAASVDATEEPDPSDGSTTSTEGLAPAEAAPAEYQPATCQFAEPAGTAVECGYLVVPQDRADPDGRKIRLHVAVFRSQSDTPKPDPIVYLEGGPGGEPLEAIDLTFEDRFSPFTAERDLIIFDQRGTGFSEPTLACQEYRDLGFDLLDDVLDPADALQAEYEVLERCRDTFLEDDIDLSDYHSAASAADVADLRRALEIDEWNLYGISYGTRLALTVMRDHPEGVRSVILDSVYPPEIDGVSQIPASAARAFRTLFDGCAGDVDCREAYPDLEGRFYALVDALDAAPIGIDLIDFFTGNTYEAMIGGDDLMGLVFQSLYSETLIPTVPQLIVSVEAGEYRDLANLASLFLANGEFFSVGMHASVQCREEVPFSDLDAAASAQDEYPYLSRIVAASITQNPNADEFCSLWGTEPGSDIENLAVESSIPTLVLAGAYDPITPPADGAAVADRLDSAVFVEFDGLGHAVSSAHPCALDITLGFLDDLDAIDTSCALDVGPPEFVVPGGPSIAVELVEFEDAAGGVTGVAPEGWESLGFGVAARQSSALDQTLLLQQAVPGGSGDLLLAGLRGQFALTTEEPVEQVDLGDRRWSLYEGAIQGYTADIALTDADGLTFLVVLVSDSSEREALVDQVLWPALEAIQGR